MHVGTFDASVLDRMYGECGGHGISPCITIVRGEVVASGGLSSDLHVSHTE